jgi:hypothetical protein
MPELGLYGSVRGALSNERPYRDLRNVDANYAFERSHRFAGIQPNSGFGDYSRLSCGVRETQLGPNARISAAVDRQDAEPDADSRHLLSDVIGVLAR